MCYKGPWPTTVWFQPKNLTCSSFVLLAVKLTTHTLIFLSLQFNHAPLGLVQTSIMLCTFAQSIWSSMPSESYFTERCWFSRSYFKCNKANKWRNDLSLNSARRTYFCRSFSPICFFLSASGLLNNISVVTCKTFKLNPTPISHLVLVYCCAIECLHTFKGGRPGRNHYYPVLLMWLTLLLHSVLADFALRIKSLPKHRMWQDQTWVQQICGIYLNSPKWSTVVSHNKSL